MVCRIPQGDYKQRQECYYPELDSKCTICYKTAVVKEMCSWLASFGEQSVSPSWKYFDMQQPVHVNYCSFDETAIGSITVTKQSTTNLVSLCYI